MIFFYDEGDLVQHRYYGTIAVVHAPVVGTHVLVRFGELNFAAWHLSNVCLCQLAPETTGDP